MKLSTILKHKSNFAQRSFATTLFRDSNQANGLASYAIDFMNNEQKINQEVYDRVRLFHTDSVICGVSALALKTNAPRLCAMKLTNGTL